VLFYFSFAYLKVRAWDITDGSVSEWEHVYTPYVCVCILTYFSILLVCTPLTPDLSIDMLVCRNTPHTTSPSWSVFDKLKQERSFVVGFCFFCSCIKVTCSMVLKCYVVLRDKDNIYPSLPPQSLTLGGPLLIWTQTP
jgi:hypothetical protein